MNTLSHRLREYFGMAYDFAKDAEKLEAENAKLRRLVQLGADMENEDPGCLECAKRKDEKWIADGGDLGWGCAYQAVWDITNKDKIGPMIEEYNKLHTELFEKSAVK